MTNSSVAIATDLHLCYAFPLIGRSGFLVNAAFAAFDALIRLLQTCVSGFVYMGTTHSMGCNRAF
jgi:hypothetical protein